MKLISYTGKGSGAAKLMANALAELKGEQALVLSPERASHHFLPYIDAEGNAIIFAMGDPSDALRLAEAFKLTGFEVLLVRPPLDGLPEQLRAKLEVYDSYELPQEGLEAAIEAGKFALEEALKDAKGPRAERLREDLKDLCCVNFEVPEGVEAIGYTESMELAALTLGEILRIPALHVQHLPKGLKSLVLTTSAEEAWARRFAFGKGKVVSLPYDPLIAPLSFLVSLKAKELRPQAVRDNL